MGKQIIFYLGLIISFVGWFVLITNDAPKYMLGFVLMFLGYVLMWLFQDRLKMRLDELRFQILNRRLDKLEGKKK